MSLFAVAGEPENRRLINGGARSLGSVGYRSIAGGQKADQLRRRVHKPGSKFKVHKTTHEVIESRRTTKTNLHLTKKASQYAQVANKSRDEQQAPETQCNSRQAGFPTLYSTTTPGQWSLELRLQSGG